HMRILLTLTFCSMLLLGCDQVNQRRARRMANEAVKQIQAQQYSSAKNTLRKAIALYDKDPYIHYLLGRAHHGGQEWEQAISSFRKTIALAPKKKQAHLYLAESYARSNKPNDAIEPYTKAIALETQQQKKAEYTFQMAQAHRKAKQFDQAAQAFEQAIKIKPQQGEYYYALALSFFDQAKQHETKQLLEQQQQESKNKKQGKSKLKAQTILKSVPEAVKPLYTKAEQVLKRAVQNKAENSDIQNLFALIHIKMHRFEQAITLCDQLAAKTAYKGGALYHKGMAYDLWFEKLRLLAEDEKDRSKKQLLLEKSKKLRDLALETFKAFLKVPGSRYANLKADINMKIR
ncbi:MAG: tetratricopeptide repeat protein, partial [Myxococcota bacterium]